MPLWFNKALNLSEGEIRSAMENSTNNADAARFLGCHKDTYKRYATRIIDNDTQMSLYDMHKYGTIKKKSFVRSTHRNPDFKPIHNWTTPVKLMDVLAGNHPGYDKKKLARRLIEELILPECCNQCKFDERRITDYQVPLVLIWKDGNTKNHLLTNLEFLCYNCYFLIWSDVKLKSFGANFKGFSR